MRTLNKYNDKYCFNIAVLKLTEQQYFNITRVGESQIAMRTKFD